MRRITLITLVLLLTLGSIGLASYRISDVVAIKEVLDTYIQAYSNADYDAYLSVFTEEISYSVDGRESTGLSRYAFAEVVLENSLLGEDTKRTKYEYQDATVEIDGNVATVELKMFEEVEKIVIVKSDGVEVEYVVQGIFTGDKVITLVKIKEQWYIASIAESNITRKVQYIDS